MIRKYKTDYGTGTAVALLAAYKERLCFKTTTRESQTVTIITSMN